MANWTYKFDRIDTQVSADDSTLGRYTFNKYLYYQPKSYDSWRKNQLSSLTYSAQLTNAGQIPEYGTHLTGALSAFYFNRVVSITNMNNQGNPNATSYGIITLQYQNRVSRNSSGSSYSSSSSSTDQKYQDRTIKKTKPWEQHVGDFTQTNYQLSTPFISGYMNNSNTLSSVQTTAKQPYGNITTSIFGAKYTWSYNTNDPNENYTISEPIINSVDFIGTGTLSGKINIPVGAGLLLPPTFKLLYYNDDETKTSTPYYQWSFEILYIPLPFGHYTDLYNAGTQAWDPIANRAYDICTWYVEDPTSSNPPVKQFGDLHQMITARRAVDLYNKNVPDSDKKVFNGNFVSQAVPLTMNGTIDFAALSGGPKVSLRYRKYQMDTWSLGWR